MIRRPVLKKLIARITGKKAGRNAYAKTEVRMPAHQDSFQARSQRLAQLRKRFLAKRRPQEPEGYGAPAGRKRPVSRYVGFLLAAAAVVALFWGLKGPERVCREMQSLTFFKVDGIQISGNRMVAKERLLEATGIILRQTSMIGLDPAKIEAQLGAVHWVKRSVVKKDWPSVIRISIEENVPVAILSTPAVKDTPMQYMDQKGNPILPVFPGADLDFPVITGLAELVDAGQREKVLAEVLTFLKKVGSNDPHLPSHSISELHVNQVGEIVVYMVEYPFPIFFGSGNTSQKYSRLVQVLRSLYKKPNAKELLSQIEYIQMDYLNDKVLVSQAARADG